MSHWQSVLHEVERSIYAEQVFCSYTTQMTFLPQFRNQPALRTVHKENYETSYHRNTAAGNLHRLMWIDGDEMLILMTIECLVEAKEHDKKAFAALRNVTADDPMGEQLLNAAFYWHKQRKRHLRRASKTLYLMAGPDLWQKGLAMAE